MLFHFRTCRICGRAIAQERLEALPETHLCVHCAEKVGTDIKWLRPKVEMDMDTYKDLLGAIRS
ncbi:MAG: TraR/DksA C4-type zinc finger protein [Halanaerobium sp.]|nr:TraR/DksA C4-type zinc finger protein [Halanaerobium sp.]